MLCCLCHTRVDHTLNISNYRLEHRSDKPSAFPSEPTQLISSCSTHDETHLPAARRNSRPAMAPIRVRLQASDEGDYVLLDARALPNNIYDVTSMLRLETAPRASWRDVAAAYLRAGNPTAAIAVLEQATSDDVDKMLGLGPAANGNGVPDAGAGSTASRTDMLAALAGVYVMCAESPVTDPADRPDLLRKAADVVSRADVIDPEQPAVWTAKGAAEAASDRAPNAKTWFENAHQNGSVPAALGLAAVCLNGTVDAAPEPHRATALLTNALHSAPCPAGAWTGLGHALFRSGNFKAARPVLRRAVKAAQSAPPAERLEALYALARVESAIEPTPASLENALAALREAYVHCGGHSDPRVLTLLAEIYFLAGNSESAKHFALRAVATADALPSIFGTSEVLSPAATLRRIIRSLARFELARARLDLGEADQAMRDLETVKALVDESRTIVTAAGAAGASASGPLSNSAIAGTSQPPVVAAAASTATTGAASAVASVGTAINPGLYLRLGLLKLSTGNPEDVAVAEDCLSKVLVQHERCAVAMRSLGIIIGRRVIDAFPVGRLRGGDQYRRAKDLLKKGIAADDEGRRDITAMLVYSALVEETDPGIALVMHERVVAILESESLSDDDDDSKADDKMAIGDNDDDGARKHEEKKSCSVPLEVYSNMASLLARLGRVAEARKLVGERIDPSAIQTNVVLTYNRARLAEMDNDYDAAIAGYDAILEKNPSYHIARIRLGYIAVNRDRNFERGEALYKEVVASKSSASMIAAGFLNQLYIATKNPKAQQQLLEVNRSVSDYMSLAFAQFMHSHLAGLGSTDRRHRFLLDHIAAPLQQILKHNKRNAFAANGVGVYFAENGMMAEAREAFSAAGSGAEVAKSARVNLAHSTIALAKAAVRAKNDKGAPGVRYTTANVPTARGLCEQAEKLYSDAHDMSAREIGQDKGTVYERLELLLYRANAKFEVGAYRSAADLLEKIVHLAPDSAPCWFNLGQVLRECAGERVLHNNKNLDEMLKAKSELEACRTSFMKALQLDIKCKSSTDPVTRTRIDRKFLDNHLKFIQQVIRSHEVSLVNARNEAEDREKLRLEKIAKILAHQRMKEEEKNKVIQRKEERQRELERAAAAAVELLASKEQMQIERNRTAAGSSDDEGVEYENDEEASAAAAKQQKKRKRRKEKSADGERPNGKSEDRKTKRKRKANPLAASGGGVNASSDEYDDDALAGIPAANSDEDVKMSANSDEDVKMAAASASEDEGDEEDGVTRTRARRRFAMAADSGDSGGEAVDAATLPASALPANVTSSPAPSSMPRSAEA
jgi:tetratricopeptide (TPR) repeat protein